jgi:hypothetical protein
MEEKHGKKHGKKPMEEAKNHGKNPWKKPRIMEKPMEEAKNHGNEWEKPLEKNSNVKYDSYFPIKCLGALSIHKASFAYRTSISVVLVWSSPSALFQDLPLLLPGNLLLQWTVDGYVDFHKNSKNTGLSWVFPFLLPMSQTPCI